MSKYVLALDQGTTSSRAILFDIETNAVATAQQEFPQIYPRPGHVEHDPEDIWNSQLRVAQQVLSDRSADDIAAIGIANQRETTLLWERESGRPIGNAVVWQSRVSAPICDRLRREGLEKIFREKTGLLLDPYFSGTKVTHLLEKTPEIRRAAERGDILFGTVDTYLIWRLTGRRVHATDVSNASRTLMFNIHEMQWDDELLSLLGVPRAMLPEVRASSEIYGETTADLFGKPIPIAGNAGDQQAATFGQACFQPGDAKNTYGTGCFLLMNTGPSAVSSQNNLLTTVGWKIGDQVTYCLEGAVFIAGAVVQWLRDGLGVISTSAEVEQLAGEVKDSQGVYFVPAFVGLGAPHWDPYARGTIVGLTRDTTRAHLARAALDSMAYQTRDVLQGMQLDSGIQLKCLRVDGGASVNNLLMQFQSDILGVPVHRPIISETTALGAAYLAGLAVGFWPDTKELSQRWQLDREFKPQMRASEREERCRDWARAVERSKRWQQAN